MSGERRRWALALGLSWHFASLAVKARRAPKAPKAVSPKNILVIGYAAIGDLIYFLPTLRAIRKGFPRAKIIYLVDKHAGTAELLPESGLVDEIWYYNHPELAHDQARQEIHWRVKERNFDAVIVSGATPMRIFASPVLQIPLRIGHCRPIVGPHQGWSAPRYALWRLRRGIIGEEFERRLALNAKVWIGERGEHTVRRNLRLVEPLGLKVTAADEALPPMPRTETAKALAHTLVPEAGRAIGLHLGVHYSQYAKIWNPARWVEVAKALSDKTGAPLVLVGGPDEAKTAADFAKAYGKPFVNAVGKCRLLETLAVIARCRLFLSSDTGMAKAAMALGVPTTTVWGPTDREELGAFWEKEKHLDISRSLFCSPCVQLGLQNEGAGVINFSNCGHRACLGELSSEEVAAKILERYGLDLAKV